MIIEDTVKINTHCTLKKYYESLGYDCSDIYVNIKISDLSKNSHIKITAKCDICGKEQKASLYAYNTNHDCCNFYCCKACAYLKREILNQEKYGKGIKNVFQLDSVKEKSANTCIKKYGVSNVNKNKDIRKKIEDTCLEKYGTKTSLENDDVRKKIENTCLEKYGVINPLLNSDIMSKSKTTLFKKYGVENPMHNEEIKNKSKETCLEKYGCENPGQNNDIKIKIKNKWIETGFMLSDDKRSASFLYTRKVKTITRRYKKELFNNWDGKDYYDNENIKENLKLKYKDQKYPTIDHKISIHYGFLNNIDPSIIGSIDNLCITKRKINRDKWYNNEYKPKD